MSKRFFTQFGSPRMRSSSTPKDSRSSIFIGIPWMEMPSGVNISMLLSEGAAGLMVATSNFGKSGFAAVPNAGGWDCESERFSEAAVEVGDDWP